MSLFENKRRLLMVEHFTCIHKHEEALEMYEASIKASRDHGNIHEMALGYELMGNFHHERRRQSESRESFNQAYVYYYQWEAVAVSRRLEGKQWLYTQGRVFKETPPKQKLSPSICLAANINMYNI